MTSDIIPFPSPDHDNATIAASYISRIRTESELQELSRFMMQHFRKLVDARRDSRPPKAQRAIVHNILDIQALYKPRITPV